MTDAYVNASASGIKSENPSISDEELLSMLRIRLECFLISMGKCPNCSNSGLFLKTTKCIICGKEGCNKCFSEFFKLIEDGRSDDDSPSTVSRGYFCSDECLKGFLDKAIAKNIKISKDREI